MFGYSIAQSIVILTHVIGENYVDYISGVKTDRNLMEGVMDSFVVGVAAGGTMSGPVSTYNEVITNPVARYRANPITPLDITAFPKVL